MTPYYIVCNRYVCGEPFDTSEAKRERQAARREAAKAKAAAERAEAAAEAEASLAEIEIERRQNIARNEEKLRQLGLL